MRKVDFTFLPEKNLLGCTGQLAELVMTEEEVHQLWNVVETSENYLQFTVLILHYTVDIVQQNCLKNQINIKFEK